MRLVITVSKPPALRQCLQTSLINGGLCVIAGAPYRVNLAQKSLMRKECFVDGRPHENRSVILSVPGLSHPFDVSIYAA